MPLRYALLSQSNRALWCLTQPRGKEADSFGVCATPHRQPQGNLYKPMQIAAFCWTEKPPPQRWRASARRPQVAHGESRWLQKRPEERIWRPDAWNTARDRFSLTRNVWSVIQNTFSFAASTGLWEKTSDDKHLHPSFPKHSPPHRAKPPPKPQFSISNRFFTVWDSSAAFQLTITSFLSW